MPNVHFPEQTCQQPTHAHCVSKYERTQWTSCLHDPNAVGPKLTICAPIRGAHPPASSFQTLQRVAATPRRRHARMRSDGPSQGRPRRMLRMRHAGFTPKDSLSGSWPREGAPEAAAHRNTTRTSQKGGLRLRKSTWLAGLGPGSPQRCVCC